MAMPFRMMSNFEDQGFSFLQKGPSLIHRSQLKVAKDTVALIVKFFSIEAMIKLIIITSMIGVVLLKIFRNSYSPEKVEHELEATGHILALKKICSGQSGHRSGLETLSKQDGCTGEGKEEECESSFDENELSKSGMSVDRQSDSTGFSSIRCSICQHLESSEKWVVVPPEVLKPTEFRHKCPPGRYECTVSGLRWVCQTSVTLHYQFSSWEHHREALMSMQYMPGGPLLDITVITGHLEEVQLPHFACIGHDPYLVDKIAVVHIEDSDMSVSVPATVTASHVKILHPTFSPLAVILHLFGWKWKVHSQLLLYKTSKAFLTLHIYLGLRSSAVEQIMKENKKGYSKIEVTYPPRPLTMDGWFSLETDCSEAEIIPEKIQLKDMDTPPDFFEVYVQDADYDRILLELTGAEENGVVWTQPLRKGDYQTISQQSGGQSFVDRHKEQLIQRVYLVEPILDRLSSKVLTQEARNKVTAEATPQDRMRALILGPLNAGGDVAKEEFYQILSEVEPLLVEDLEEV